MTTRVRSSKTRWDIDPRTGNAREWRLSPGADRKSMNSKENANGASVQPDCSAEIAKLQHALNLMTAGREQDQSELRRCVLTLEAIASDYEWMKRKEMVQRAGEALCDIGAWRKVSSGEFARHGRVVSLSKPMSGQGPDAPVPPNAELRHGA